MGPSMSTTTGDEDQGLGTHSSIEDCPGTRTVCILHCDRVTGLLGTSLSSSFARCLAEGRNFSATAAEPDRLLVIGDSREGGADGRRVVEGERDGVEGRLTEERGGELGPASGEAGGGMRTTTSET